MPKVHAIDEFVDNATMCNKPTKTKGRKPLLVAGDGEQVTCRMCLNFQEKFAHREKIVLDEDFDISPLVTAIVLKAAKDARDRSAQVRREARKWLRTEAYIWLDGIGFAIHPEEIVKWANKGFKMPEHRTANIGTRLR